MRGRILAAVAVLAGGGWFLARRGDRAVEARTRDRLAPAPRARG